MDMKPLLSSFFIFLLLINFVTCFWGVLIPSLTDLSAYIIPKALLDVTGIASFIGSILRPKCAVHPWYFDDITSNLDKEVSGQHIAISHARWAVKSHMEDSQPKHALSIIFLGSTGTGKNYVSNIIADAIFGRYSRYVHFYTGRLDFPLESKVDEYKLRLQNEVAQSVKECERSIFIFDEIDKMPGGVIDGLKPFLDYHPSIQSVDYRKAIFLFLTNVGGREINQIFLNYRNKGIVRESLKYVHFEQALRRTLFGNEGMFQNSAIISDHLISMYLPFLPLEKKHVIHCIKKGMAQRGKPVADEKINSVLEKMEFQDGLSVAGCKRVLDFLAVELYAQKYPAQHIEF